MPRAAAQAASSLGSECPIPSGHGCPKGKFEQVRIQSVAIKRDNNSGVLLAARELTPEFDRDF
jgi:hypothetical protein